MRPTGKLHLGNYMGALANWVKLQDEYECYFFIADCTPDHGLRRYLAGHAENPTRRSRAGFPRRRPRSRSERALPAKHVLQHAELLLLFSMITPLGWLERVPTYKEQQENLTGKDLSTYGFLGYPLLQAADILLYQPNLFPSARTRRPTSSSPARVARRFNQFYKLGGRARSIARTKVLLTPSPKLPGTDGRKMSKSYGNTIQLTDPEPRFGRSSRRWSPIRRASAAPIPAIRTSARSATCTKSFPPLRRCRGLRRLPHCGIGCIQCKGWAADALVQSSIPFRSARHFTEAQAMEIIEAGSDRARIAQQRKRCNEVL
jgi:tryptophanyl-tRNA synthetase